MPVVRCPTHDIPYNTENPRGCPACAAEREGASQADIMRELARTSQSAQRPSGTTRPSSAVGRGEEGVSRSSRSSSASPRISSARYSIPIAPPLTPPPRAPAAEEGGVSAALRRFASRRTLSVAGGLSLLLLAWLVLTSGPRYIDQPHPQPLNADETVRPLPIQVNGHINGVFAVLGNRPPTAVPDQPRLARYSYGTGLEVDAINDRVYAITVRVASRTWAGLQVGMPERTAEGTLALLGTPVVLGTDEGRGSVIEGYLVFPSLEQRPRRTLAVAVRPPNGCYDVQVDLQPRAQGILALEGRRYAVIGRRGTAYEWVVTQIRIVSRSMRGPYAEGVVC